ncbi:MAG: B12-binding domain-containing radical SAM protein [Eubacteriales bacterium]
MKIVLGAINAKYIHSNLAIYNLRAFANQYGCNQKAKIELAEYTINQQTDEILMDLYKKQPDVLALSCYIWNIEYVKEIIIEIHKLYPAMPIWVGGPEVSYCAESLLEEMPQITGVMIAEGEETFTELVEHYEETKALEDIKGIVYRLNEQEIIRTEYRPILDLTKVPFVYDQIEEFENKIIYYESSRGCPFSCSYCLSSIDKKLRFRDTEVVKEELGKFLNHKVKQVKFVDRTFNCNHKHSMEIWNYINEHDNGITNFHFEVAADLITDEEISLIARMRKGLIQLEIGVQSTCEETIKEIKRVMDFEQVSEVVKKVQAGENIHQHLDLIAGLPFENYERFAQSFDEVYNLHPEQLQLGFLKVLKGSYMSQQQEAYGLVHQSKPPYEILYNNWLSYQEVLRLKGIEDMVEVYYNSGQFATTMRLLEREFTSPFSMYEAMSDFYDRKMYRGRKHTRVARFDILYQFILEIEHADINIYYEGLMKDLYLRENAKTRPAFARSYEVDKTLVRRFFEIEEETRAVLVGYEGFDKRQMSKMTHIEVLEGKHVLFDYRNRNPLTYEASTWIIEECFLQKEYKEYKI